MFSICSVIFNYCMLLTAAFVATHDENTCNAEPAYIKKLKSIIGAKCPDICRFYFQSQKYRKAVGEATTFTRDPASKKGYFGRKGVPPDVKQPDGINNPAANTGKTEEKYRPGGRKSKRNEELVSSGKNFYGTEGPGWLSPNKLHATLPQSQETYDEYDLFHY